MSENKIKAYKLSISIKPDDINVSYTDKNEQNKIGEGEIESAFPTNEFYILKDMDLSKTNIPLRNFKSSTGLLKALGDMYLPPDVLDKEKYDYETGKKKQNRIVVNNINFLLGKIFDTTKEVSIPGFKSKYRPTEVKWDKKFDEDDNKYEIEIEIGLGLVSSSGYQTVDSSRAFCSRNHNALKKMIKKIMGKTTPKIKSYKSDKNKSVLNVNFKRSKGGKRVKTKKHKTKYNKKNRSKNTTIKRNK